MSDSTLANGPDVPAVGHGGPFPSGQPRVIVIHDIECPLGVGWARSLAVNWMQHSGLSVHYIVDPGEVVQCLSESLIGWGAGTVNSAAIHIEQSGYARFTRDEWTTPDGLAQIMRVGALVADIAARHSIPVRWLSDADLHAAWQGTGPGGMATHSDCTRVIGGTTHTDPGTGYPRDLLLTAALPAPTPDPAPTDLLGWIMTLPGAPANLTYQQFVSDIVAGVFSHPLTVRSAIKVDAQGKPSPDANLTFEQVTVNGYNYDTVTLKNTQ